MHTHKLDKSNHQNFLSEGRIDPITGEKILAGDEIVICAACKSAFLKETWVYLGKKHCGQRETAQVLPKRSALSLKKRHVLGEILYRQKEFKIPDWFAILALIIALPFFLIPALLVIIGLIKFSPIVIAAMPGISITVWGIRSLYRNHKPEKYAPQIAVVREHGIQIEGKKEVSGSYPYASLKEIHLYMTYTDKSQEIRLAVVPNSGKPFWVAITNDAMDFRKLSRIIFELHEKVKVSFTVHDSGDYKRLTRMAREVGKDIRVTHKSNNDSADTYLSFITTIASS